MLRGHPSQGGTPPRPQKAPRQPYARSRLGPLRPRSSSAPATASAHPLPAWQLHPGRAATSSAVRLFVDVPWRRGRLHGSLGGGPWRDFPLQPVTSAPGKWLACQIAVPAAAAQRGASATTPLLEFVLTDGGSTWLKGDGGGNFVVREPGLYQVATGGVTPVAGTPVMVVSDLDGTMVGDDAATAAFKAWWESRGVVRGGVLVYNTGRSLASFEALLASKAHSLAHPDALISAVGTRVFEFSPSSGAWVEDAGWSTRLDVGWDGRAVREASYAALAKVGRDMMHFRPPEEQNAHKVTCGVNTSVLPQVLEQVQGALSAAGADANLITSGTGDWRFLDIVPRAAGKLEALEYVRERYGFPVEATIACGDSGNDILMLSGRNLALAVGNSQPDLVRWLDAHAGADASPLAGKQRLWRASKHEALGILEGLEYWGYA